MDKTVAKLLTKMHCGLVVVFLCALVCGSAAMYNYDFDEDTTFISPLRSTAETVVYKTEVVFEDDILVDVVCECLKESICKEDGRNTVILTE